MRLIFDTRIANAYFTAPPHTSLPSAASWSQQELRAGDETYFSGGDIECAFYRMEVPKPAQEFMTLPPVRAKFVCPHLCLDGVEIPPDSFVTPQLRVLPMGWSWALWICQMVHEHIGRSVGQQDCDQVTDKAIPRPLTHNDSRHGKYVDYFLSLSHDPAESARSASSLREGLEGIGLSCHEQEEASLHITFAGLDFDGTRNTVRVSRRRTWRLRLAIEFVLSQQQLSGAQLEALV